LLSPVHYGIGKHIASLTPHELEITFKSLYVTIILYNVAMGFTKFSILIQYLRIFTTSKGFKIAVYTTMAIVGAYEAWSIISAIIFCWPVSKFWDVTMRGGHCLDRKVVWYVHPALSSLSQLVRNSLWHRFANAGINIGTDIAIGVLPLPMINTLHLARRTKITLMVIFGLGGL
jgi:hypothetical protein